MEREGGGKKKKVTPKMFKEKEKEKNYANLLCLKCNASANDAPNKSKRHSGAKLQIIVQLIFCLLI